MYSSGTEIGRFKILSTLGAGGMGEVYRAQDARLGREIALKVLPSAFASDDDRLRRFEQEAQAAGMFSHPNIVTVYETGMHDGSPYLATELLQGQTLRQRLQQDAIPLRKALEYAQQIARGLGAAHERGVTHRDLKPENLFVTRDGTVKVLDFGLAKFIPQDTAMTTMEAHTGPGQMIGTAAYMSPEQLQAKRADHRSDIFSFGLILYEMIAGKHPFRSPTLAETMAKIAGADAPPLESSPALDSLVRRCLEKSPEERFQSARDIGFTLQSLASQTGPLSGTGELPNLPVDVPLAETVPASKWPWAVTGVFALAALALAAVHFRERPPAPPAVARFQIRLPDKVSFTSGTFTLSPDGRHVAFSATGEDKVPRVWIQDLDSLEARVLRDTYTGSNPPPFFWSPDSRFVAYSENSPKLKKVDVQTGALQDICEKPGPPIGGAWNNTGTIIFGSTSTGLWKVSAAGGKPAPLTVLDSSKHERQHELPSFLPDGKHFLYLRVSAVAEESGIFEGSLDEPPERQSRKRILSDELGAYFSPSGEKGLGKLVFLSGDTLMAQPFDPGRMELNGEPSPIAAGVGSVYQTGFFSVSPGTLAYRTSTSIRDYQLTWFDRQGKQLGTAGEPGSIASVSISPDGARVAYRKDSGNLADHDIWLLDLRRGTSSRFTFGPGIAELPLWSPDGSELVFSSNRDGAFNLYRKPANGARQETVLVRSNLNKRAMSWSKDGKFLLYCASPSVGGADDDIWVLPMQGNSAPSPFLQTPFDECGKLSPDGRWVAYESSEGGRYDVYVREFVRSVSAQSSAPAGGKWLVSKDGGSDPDWREDGKELVYTDQRGMIVSVSVDTTRGFQAGTPQDLFPIPSGVNTLSHTGDMKRFLIPVPVERKGAQGFTVVLNWMSAPKP